MPTPLLKTEALLLIRKAQEETAPVELIGTGPGQQSIKISGFAAVEDDAGEIVSIHVPGQVAVFFELNDAEFEYTESRERSAAASAGAERTLDFAIGLKKAEWHVQIRVWKQPGNTNVH
jgi:hypothetical protein